MSLKLFKPGDLVRNVSPFLFKVWGVGLILKVMNSTGVETYPITYLVKFFPPAGSEVTKKPIHCEHYHQQQIRFEYAYKKEK